MSDVNYEDSENVRDELGKRSLPISDEHDENVDTLKTALSDHDESVSEVDSDNVVSSPSVEEGSDTGNAEEGL